MSGKFKIAPSCFSRICSFSSDQNFRPSGTSREARASESWCALVCFWPRRVGGGSNTQMREGRGLQEYKQIWRSNPKTLTGNARSYCCPSCALLFLNHRLPQHSSQSSSTSGATSLTDRAARAPHMPSHWISAELRKVSAARQNGVKLLGWAIYPLVERTKVMFFWQMSKRKRGAEGGRK